MFSIVLIKKEKISFFLLSFQVNYNNNYLWSTSMTADLCMIIDESEVTGLF